MRTAVSTLLATLTRLPAVAPYVTDRYIYWSLDGLNVQLFADGAIRVRGDYQSTADRVTRELESKLPALALLYASQRIRAGIKRAANVTSEERLGPNAYRLRATI